MEAPSTWGCPRSRSSVPNRFARCESPSLGQSPLQRTGARARRTLAPAFRGQSWKKSFALRIWTEPGSWSPQRTSWTKSRCVKRVSRDSRYSSRNPEGNAHRSTLAHDLTRHRSCTHRCGRAYRHAFGSQLIPSGEPSLRIDYHSCVSVRGRGCGVCPQSHATNSVLATLLNFC